MNDRSVGALIERVFLVAFRLSSVIAGQAWWRLFAQHVRNAKWRARLCALGQGSRVYRYVVIHGPENVSIGKRCAIAEFVHIWGGGGVTIGNNVMIASHSVITSLTHDSKARSYRDTMIRKSVMICDDAWVGAGAVILPGVRIGARAIVGAGAVVTKDVPDGWLAVGSPMRLIQRRQETLICEPSLSREFP